MVFLWQGRDRQGRLLSGELRAHGPASVGASLRRQGIQLISVRARPRRFRTAARHIRKKDIAVFTRQLATMLKAGIALLQAFDIVARSQSNPALAALIRHLHSDVSSGMSLQQALATHPRHFDALYCQLVAAGEQAGLLDDILDSLARHQEKTLAITSQLRSALLYPLAILVCATLVTAVIMIWVVPSFAEVFASFGAALPWPTQIVIAISGWVAAYWWLVLSAAVAGSVAQTLAWRRSAAWRAKTDRLLLRLPWFGQIVRQSCLSRWSRTLAAMLGAGVPLVAALQSAAGAAGNAVYATASALLGQQLRQGSSLAAAIDHAGPFPPMVGQMVAIGEASGTLEHMLLKVADFYEIEANETRANLSTLLEPIIMLVLGIVIGGLLIAMYLPIFKLGAVI